jgi:16S rRNA (guanine527-N7)-methyltransferase
MALDLNLSSIQREQVDRLLALLAEDAHAPTAVRDRGKAWQIHIADSLIALELDAVASARGIADIGSGAGFPGLALAIACPGAEVYLVESQRRACAFLELACDRACLVNARVVCVRAEDWADGVGQNDVVVARAVASQPVVLEYAAPLLRVGGTLVDWRGKRSQDEEESSRAACRELGLELREIRRVIPFEGARDRHLHVFEKVSETPTRFPRRAGMARKRPLGGV